MHAAIRSQLGGGVWGAVLMITTLWVLFGEGAPVHPARPLRVSVPHYSLLFWFEVANRARRDEVALRDRRTIKTQAPPLHPTPRSTRFVSSQPHFVSQQNKRKKRRASPARVFAAHPSTTLRSTHPA